MAEYGEQAQYGWPMTEWNPPARRTSSLITLGVAAVFLVIGLALFFMAPGAAGWFLWVAFAVLILALLFILAVIFSEDAANDDAPPWLARMFGAEPAAQEEAYAPPEESGEPAAPAHADIDLRCPECENVFTAHDTGERPLHTNCPHCGAEGLVDLPPPEPAEADTLEEPEHEDAYEHDHAAEAEPIDDGDLGLDDQEEPQGDFEEIQIRCPACGTEFSVEDKGERPLKAVCPGCGRGGRLR